MAYQKRNATLKDIAEKTGFSINTVSRALRDMDDISEATKKKIRKASKELGHVENSIAQSLRLGYTNTIAVIIGDVSNPFFAIQMKEVETYARRAGYNTFLINTNEDEQQEEIAIKSALNQMVAGIIICPTQKSDKNILFLKKSGIPFVLQEDGSQTSIPTMSW